MAEQLKRPIPASGTFEELNSKTAVLDARSLRADQRDVELAGATNQLREQVDAIQCNGTKLPYTARELFLRPIPMLTEYRKHATRRCPRCQGH